MSRFVIEHLPRIAAQYNVIPVECSQARIWLEQSGVISLVRTTEMISAMDAGLGVSLAQSDASMMLQEGDEALLVGISFSVLLAWAEGKIAPVDEDWRCFLLTVERSTASVAPVLRAAVAEPLSAIGETTEA